MGLCQFFCSLWSHKIGPYNRHFGPIFCAKICQNCRFLAANEANSLYIIGPKNRHFGMIFSVENHQIVQENFMDVCVFMCVWYLSDICMMCYCCASVVCLALVWYLASILFVCYNLHKARLQPWRFFIGIAFNFTKAKLDLQAVLKGSITFLVSKKEKNGQDLGQKCLVWKDFEL